MCFISLRSSAWPPSGDFYEPRSHRPSILCLSNVHRRLTFPRSSRQRKRGRRTPRRPEPGARRRRLHPWRPRRRRPHRRPLRPALGQHAPILHDAAASAIRPRTRLDLVPASRQHPNWGRRRARGRPGRAVANGELDGIDGGDGNNGGGRGHVGGGDVVDAHARADGGRGRGGCGGPSGRGRGRVRCGEGR